MPRVERSKLQDFQIIPVLGRKVDVPADSPTLFQFIGENVALTHDVGGVNFDLGRKKGACTKSYGYSQWSASANAQATKCLGLFELYDGTNLNHLIFDNGKIYYYNSALAPTAIDASTPVTLATDNVDLYSIIQVGAYFVVADRAEHAPYKWKHGDTNISLLIASGTSYEFRYLEAFQRRVIGLYSAETDGDIEIRWSTDWPTTGITSLNFPAANQLYIPNDDSITGGRTMGHGQMFIYCENSIQELVYYPDYAAPFRCRTVVADQGAVNHHSIVPVGNRHFVFNKGYGFCEYRGGAQFPYGGRPISENIESDLQGMNTAYYNLIVGTFVPLTREVAWTVCMGGSASPNYLLFYNIDTGQWRWEDKIMRYVDNWRLYPTYSWNSLITELGGTGAVWTTAGTNTWADYTSQRQKLVYANTDGHLYYQASEGLDGSALDGYRIEPIMDFGDAKRRDLLREIWFDLSLAGDYSIDISHRSGDTAGEVAAASWTSLDSLSHNSPTEPRIYLTETARLHQIKWGTNLANEKSQVNGITFRYLPQSRH